MDRSTVLVVREDDEFSEVLRAGGLDVINLPLIATQPLPDQSELRSALANIEDYAGLFFTSPAAADVFVKEIGVAPGDLNAKIYAMGSRANRILEHAGFPVKYNSSINSAAELVNSLLPALDGKRYLFLRGDRSMLTIPKMLGERARVDEVIVYRTVKCPIDGELLKRMRDSLSKDQIGWICFFSPSGAEAFSEDLDIPSRARIAAIGDTTAQKARQLGFSVDFVSPRSSASEFASALLAKINDK